MIGTGKLPPFAIETTREQSCASKSVKSALESESRKVDWSSFPDRET